jgi:hypothetical protein
MRESCILCADSQAPLFIGGTVGAGIIVGTVWRFTRVEDSHFHDGVDAADIVSSIDSVAAAVSRNVAFMGIAGLHLHMSSINFGLPFGYPDWLAEFSKFIGSVFGFDWSFFSNPECTFPDDTSTTTILYVRLLAANGGFILLSIILVGVGRCTNSKEHSVNAVSALY